jgi:hypothetical protein
VHIFPSSLWNAVARSRSRVASRNRSATMSPAPPVLGARSAESLVKAGLHHDDVVRGLMTEIDLNALEAETAWHATAEVRAAKETESVVQAG